MPQLDQNTMNWLTGVFAPLLAALVAALVGAGGAFYGVRWEAERAEKRAAADALKRERRDELTRAYSGRMDLLYQAARGLQAPNQDPVQWGPIDDDVAVLGNATAVAELEEFCGVLAFRPAHSGLDLESMTKMTLVHQALQKAFRAQLERIEAGQAPERFTIEAYRAAVDAARGKFARTS